METEYIRPSSLHRVMLCPGSYELSKNCQQADTEASLEGTLLHGVLADSVSNGLVPNVDGLTPEQEIAVTKCVDFLKRILDEWEGEKYDLFAELPVELEHDNVFLTKGTADIVAVSHTREEAFVVDWKFGRNEVPEAENNPQLATYCAAVSNKFDLPGSVSGYIYMPRLDKSTKATYADPEQISSVVYEATQKAFGSSIVLNPSDEACRFCPAKTSCPAYQKSFSQLACRPDLSVMPPEKLERLYIVAQSVKKWIENDLENAVSKYLDEHGSLGCLAYKEQKGRRTVKDINGLSEALETYVLPGDILRCCSCSISALENLAIPAIQAKMQETSTTKVTKISAKEKLNEIVGRFSEEGKPSRRISCTTR